MSRAFPARHGAIGEKHGHWPTTREPGQVGGIFEPRRPSVHLAELASSRGSIWNSIRHREDDDQPEIKRCATASPSTPLHTRLAHRALRPSAQRPSIAATLQIAYVAVIADWRRGRQASCKRGNVGNYSAGRTPRFTDRPATRQPTRHPKIRKQPHEPVFERARSPSQTQANKQDVKRHRRIGGN